MKRFAFSLAVLTLMGAALEAREPRTDGDWYLDKPIREIRFEGLRRVSRVEMDGLMAPYVNKPFTDQIFRDIQAVLYGLDFFEGFIRPEVQKGDPEGNVVVLIFHVQEKPSIKEIRFEGNRRLSSQELRGKITLKIDDLLTSPKIRRDERALRNFYIEKGYTTARISSEVLPVEGLNRVILVFKIEEGAQTLVRSLRFEGNSFATEGSLKGVLASKEQAFFQSGVFKESNIILDRQNIENYYWDHGFIDARVLETRRETEIEPETGRVYLHITYVIYEGEQFIYGGMSFEGNEIFSSQTLGELVRQRPGEILSKRRLDADYTRVLDLYYENGYIFNTIERKEIREGNTISYVVSIVERPRARIENIIVRGNTKTKENVILREIPLEPGDVFSKAKIIEGIRNLNNLQYFSAISPETPQGSVEGLMDIVLSVEEANTAQIQFGLAFSGATEFPVSGNVKWQDRNFLGRGQTLGVEANVSPFQQSISANFSEPWFFDRRITLGGSFSVGHVARSNVAQDVVFPFFDRENIPDPYDNTTFVFTRTSTHLGVVYQAGQIFPGIPSATDISTHNLMRQFEWDQRHGTLRSGQNPMTLNEWSFSLGANVGYSLFTFLGRFIFGTGLNSAVQFITYDEAIYRPSSKALRDNLNAWLLENSLPIRTFWDTRDFIFNPENGTLLGFNYTVVGGFLQGAAHFTRLRPVGEANLRLLHIPLADWYTYRLVARVRSVVTFIMDPIGRPAVVAQPKHLLFVDGMTFGRGWRPAASLQNGFSTWSINFELRQPVVENLLWLDTYFDVFSLKFVNDPLLPMDITDLYFSYGFGLRVINPQLPIGIYLARTFRVEGDRTILWQPGDGIFGPRIDMRLILTFGFDLY